MITKGPSCSIETAEGWSTSHDFPTIQCFCENRISLFLKNVDRVYLNSKNNE